MNESVEGSISNENTFRINFTTRMFKERLLILSPDAVKVAKMNFGGPHRAAISRRRCRDVDDDMRRRGRGGEDARSEKRQVACRLFIAIVTTSVYIYLALFAKGWQKRGSWETSEYI